jgi:hypothetical protein
MSTEGPKDFSRVTQMSDAELDMWLTVFKNVEGIEFRLASLEANFSPGRRIPSGDVSDALAAIKVEIKRRAVGKGGE